MAQIGKKPGVSSVQLGYETNIQNFNLAQLVKKWDAQATVFRPTQMTQNICESETVPSQFFSKNLASFLNPDLIKFFIDITP